MYAVLKAIAWAIIKIFYPTRVIGKENFIKNGSIIICNHYSGWDIPIAFVFFPYRMNVLAKKELFKFKPLGALYKKLGAISIDRQNVHPSTMKEVVKKLKSGGNLLLYPEGTRNKSEDGLLASLKNGAAFFALLSGVPVIPMMLDRKPRLFCRNILMVGEPVRLEGLKLCKEDIEKASFILKSKMEEVKDNIEKYKEGKK